jgi:hypothetical protein
MIDRLFIVLRATQEFFTYMETSPLPVEGLMLCTQGVCAMKDLFFLSHPKDRPN